MKKALAGALFVSLISGCGLTPSSDTSSNDSQQKLVEILEQQDETTKSRYQYRNPLETLTFFGIEPGMRVVEFLPGGGWYSQILVHYLGQEGELIGVDYPMSLFKLFDFATPEFMQQRQQWGEEWKANREDWGGEDAAQMQAYSLGSIPESLNGSVDAVLFIRALHNMARFNDQGGYLDQALQRSFELLKPGGTVGVVQHASPEGNSDAWAKGDNAYLKPSFIKQKFNEAGFEFVAESDINANPKDVPTETESVWRLPPSLATSKDDPELKARMEAIGESNRMTLKFRKPLK